MTYRHLDILAYISIKSQAKGDGLKLWVRVIIRCKIISGNYWNGHRDALESPFLVSKRKIWRHFGSKLD